MVSVPTIYNNWLGITLIIKEANRKYYLTMEVANIAYPRYRMYAYCFTQKAVLYLERRQTSDK